MDKKTKKRIAVLKEKLKILKLRLSGMKKQPAKGDNPQGIEREIADLEEELNSLRK